MRINDQTTTKSKSSKLSNSTPSYLSSSEAPLSSLEITPLVVRFLVCILLCVLAFEWLGCEKIGWSENEIVGLSIVNMPVFLKASTWTYPSCIFPCVNAAEAWYFESNTFFGAPRDYTETIFHRLEPTESPRAQHPAFENSARI